MEYITTPQRERMQKIQCCNIMRLTRNSWLFLMMLTAIFFVSSFYYINVKYQEIESRRAQFNSLLKYRKNLNSERPNVRVYDLRKPLDKTISESIECRQSGEYQRITVTLCLHDKDRDVVSKALWLNGLWEEHIMRIFTYYVNKYPNWLVIDAGAQIGQYSLMAAKLGARVIAIEPFYDNLVRIHKAATQENVTSRITLIRNALFNKRNEIKKLGENLINIGGQSLIDHIDDRPFYKSLTSNIINDDNSKKYFVETILLDDIVRYLPRKIGPRGRAQGLLTDKAIIKMDIEGLEPYVIPTGESLFEVMSVQIVFMEWGKMPEAKSRELVEQMIQFFLKRNFVPHSIENMILSVDKWASWPFDMYWIKKNLI